MDENSYQNKENKDSEIKLPENPNKGSDDISALQKELSDLFEGAKKSSEKKETEIKNKSSQKEEVKVEDTFLDPIKTYKKDISEAAHEHNIGGKAIQETRREEAELKEDREEKTKKTLKLLFTVLFLLTGAAIVFYAIFLAPEESSEVEAIREDDIVFYDELLKADLTNLEPEIIKNRLVDLVRTSNLSEGITNLELYYAITNEEGERLSGTSLVTPTQLFNLLELDYPRRIEAALERDFMFGIYKGDQQSAFIVLKHSSVQRILADMSDWEDTLANDFHHILSGRNLGELDGSWENEAKNNLSSRVFKSPGGIPLMYYSLLSLPDTVVISVDKEALLEVNDRIKTPKGIIQ